MEKTVFLDREDHKTIEDEERNLFVRGVLEELGVPIEEIWDETELTIEKKIQLRDLLFQLDLEIVEDGDRGLKIYHGKDLIATWDKPRFVLRKDMGARTLAKQLYYEMVIKTWSIFDQENDDRETDTD